jgi:hypothetical protein
MGRYMFDYWAQKHHYQVGQSAVSNVRTLEENEYLELKNKAGNKWKAREESNYWNSGCNKRKKAI